MPDEIVGLAQVRESFLDKLDLLKFLHFHIAGVEVTQGIQYYRASQHLSDPADRGADNAVTLVAGKPAWIRVYVDAGLFAPGTISGVTGTLEVHKRVFGVLYVHVATLAPQPPGTVTAEHNPAYVAQRSNLGSTLNFILPADKMCGNLKLIAKVTTPGGATSSTEVHLDVTLRQTLRLRGIMVAYNGPSSTAPGAPTLTLAAPTLTDLQTTSSWALRAFPVESAATYSSAGSITLTVPLSDAPSCAGCCTPNWISLNAQVAAQVTADGNKTDVLYYGLIAAGVPMGPIIGCESSGVSAGGVGNGITLAHELGHHCSFPHAPCGGVGTPDPTFPAYEPYDPNNTPTASIGEYGLDISNGNIMPPSMFKDMMSYCGPKWISLHNYGRLINHSKLDPRRSCVDWPWWRDYILQDPGLVPELWLPDPPPDPFVRIVDPVKVVSVIGVLHSEREFELQGVMRVESQPTPVGGKPTEMTVRLLDADGAVLADAPVHELRSLANCDCDDCPGGQRHYPALVQALVPDRGRGAELVLSYGEDVLWSRRAPEERPRIEAFAASISDGRLMLRLDAGHSETEPETWVQWASGSDDAWHTLITGMRSGVTELDARLLPPGPCRLRVSVSDGFDTATQIVRLTVPRRGPDVAILAPHQDEILVAGNAMRLWGVVSAGGPDDSTGVEWLLDGERVGEGADLFETAPPAGSHTVELRATSGRRRSTTRVQFETIDLEQSLREHLD